VQLILIVKGSPDDGIIVSIRSDIVFEAKSADAHPDVPVEPKTIFALRLATVTFPFVMKLIAVK
jgi:hypothetical protein